MARPYVEVCGFIAFLLYGVSILCNNVVKIIDGPDPYAYVAISCTGLGIVLATIALLILVCRTFQRETMTKTDSLLFTDGDHQMVN